MTREVRFSSTDEAVARVENATPLPGARGLTTILSRAMGLVAALRGGPLHPYRLKVESAAPSFQLFTTPENLTVRRGQTTTRKLPVRVEGAAPLEQVPPRPAL